ncbi:MAG: S9 family peptidase [Proteobacteria bacterium]|nr:S9 family peptidase [Pseudomonadota bacterium]
MTRAGCGALLVLLACGGRANAESAAPTANAAVPPAPPALEIFGRLPAMREVRLSPNGKLVAMEEEQAGVRKVTIFDVDGGKTRHQVAVDEANRVVSLAWADDETLLLNVSIKHSYTCNPNVLCATVLFRTLAVRMDGSPARVLLNNEGARKNVTGSHLLAARTTRPGTVTMSTLDYGVAQGHWYSAVYEVDARTGKEKVLARGTRYTEDWVVDAAGVPIARSEWVPDFDQFTIVARDGDRWREIFRLTDGSTLSLAGVDITGRNIVALGNNGTDLSQAWSIPLDGSPASSLVSHPEVEIDVAIYDANRHAVVGVRSTDNNDTHWFDPVLATQHKSLQNAFKGLDVHVIDRSVVGRRVLVQVENMSSPPVYQLVDFEQRRADIVAEAYPGLDRAALGTVRYFKYNARDGTPIPAYLTLPPGRAATDLPVVILPHGGPRARDVAEFDWLTQFLATRGYAVLQPQFRGSTGYGKAFEKAGYRQWGGLMQDDVSDGVRHLIATGVANPGRVCIVGMSYGGYAALAGAAFTPDLYACAASVNGISDLPSMIGERKKQFGSGSVEYWKDHVGSASEPNTVEKSPSRSAASFKAPVLLLHGVDDTVVPIQQSRTMERELKAAGKPVTLVSLAGEDHWLSRSATRTRVLQELETFLAQHLH